MKEEMLLMNEKLDNLGISEKEANKNVRARHGGTRHSSNPAGRQSQKDL